ncbi:T9SS type A sorting domain-containing protein [Flavobacterium lindanitolerans]|uniref:Secreted protein (Por secretion system target) n=1 Tax=Flavobacterium lindanitolerans TaxID=428988 RepID=A0A497TZT0_9FLAO|nr:T9SS type A sorting domain-containing protein [Flavobacterium lindanitolerans]PKW20467.1 putative secreted protein (Por secretion system target) [Flavobacterium lindanitolerans]RLJ23910.1 putative secreted protein (Por secretion system target) [Flavobacterium lindanitolerans]
MQTKILFVLIVALLCTPVQAQDILWEKSYGGKHSDYLFDAQPTPDYGFILAGSSLSNKSGNKTDDGNGDLDYFIWKMDEKGDLDWQKSFGGSGADMLQSIRLTRDGGFILAGTSDSEKDLHKKDSCRGLEDFWILKLNAKGAEQWQCTIGGSGQELLQCIVPTIDGGYVIGGSSSSGKSSTLKNGVEDLFGKTDKCLGNLDYFIVKLDSDGKIEWQKTYGGQYSDELRSVLQTSDGGYLLGGSSNSPESGNKREKNYGESDYWVIKLDSSGTLEWQKTFGGNADDQLQSVQQTIDGNYILAGYSNSSMGGNKTSVHGKGTDFWLVKIDTAGAILWQKSYDNGATDILTSIEENADGSLLLAGHSKSEVTVIKKKDREGINDFFVIKTDELGQEQWTKNVGSANEDILRKAFQTRDGGYLLAGTSSGGASRDRSSIQGRNDFWVVKLKDRKKKEEKRKSLEAFPNPTLHYSNVVLGYDFEKGTATVYDISGRQLQHFELTAGRTIPVDLGGVPEGIYIVEIRTNIQSDSVKIAKTVNKNN